VALPMFRSGALTITATRLTIGSLRTPIVDRARCADDSGKSCAFSPSNSPACSSPPGIILRIMSVFDAVDPGDACSGVRSRSARVVAAVVIMTVPGGARDPGDAGDEDTTRAGVIQIVGASSTRRQGFPRLSTRTPPQKRVNLTSLPCRQHADGLTAVASSERVFKPI